MIVARSAAPYVDPQGAHTLGALGDELRALGSRLQAVEARTAVRGRLRGEGLDARLGGIDRFTSIADVVDAAQKGVLHNPDSSNRQTIKP